MTFDTIALRPIAPTLADFAALIDKFKSPPRQEFTISGEVVAVADGRVLRISESFFRDLKANTAEVARPLHATMDDFPIAVNGMDVVVDRTLPRAVAPDDEEDEDEPEDDVREGA